MKIAANNQMLTFEQLHKDNKVTPIVVLNNINNAVRVAEILVENGFNTMEFALRTPNAFKIIENIAKRVPQMYLGAATVRSAGDFLSAYNAGANYIVSPGATSELFVAARSHRSVIRYLPGVVTPSEAILAQSEGFNILKYFPCADFNGYKIIQSIHYPMPELKFCPSGGITFETMDKYLTLPNVLSIGMECLVNQQLADNGDFDHITKNLQLAKAKLEEIGLD